MISVPMSDRQFAAATQRLHANGIDLTGPTGTLTKDGVTARYTHADGTLTVEIIDRPFYYPLSLVESKLQSYLEQSVAYDADRSAL
jgi:hypothetical protein